MRILLTVHQFFPHYTMGTEVLTLSVAKELLKRGHEVCVYTGYPSRETLRDDERFDEYEFEGIHVCRFHHEYAPMGGQDSMLELSYDNHLAASYFERVLEKFRPDIVHFFHLNRLGTGLIDLAARRGIPAFMTPTDFWAFCHTAQLVLCDGSLCRGPSAHAGNCVRHFARNGQRGVFGRMAGMLPTPLVDLLVQLTQKDILPNYPYWQEIKAIGNRLGVNISRINRLNKILSPNGFMTEMLKRHGVAPQLIVQSAFGIDVCDGALNMPRPSPRHPLRIGFIGTLANYKGCHVLIDAFKTLRSGQAVLKIYGRMADFPDYAAHLQDISAGRDDIEFCGVFPNSKILEVLADLDVLVVPSLWYENTPLVVYSAQAARCPVVASDFPGIREVIRHESNGLLFQAGNPGALAEQLSRLTKEDGLVRRLSANSSPPKMTAAYVDELLDFWAAA